MTDQEVLELLNKIDNDYQLTETETKDISGIKNITWKKIEKIPESIDVLTDLNELNIFGEIHDNSSLIIIPESIGNLSGLQSLNLNNMRIHTLPESIGNLSNLQNLNLRSTKIRTLPESIGDLPSLQNLNLRSTQIRTLPESIGRLTSLQSLNLGYTKIRTLPESIGDLRSLQSLDLGYTQIRMLPKSVMNLTSLQSLDLHLTQISTLPESISDLRSLQSLDLNLTQIFMLPESIGDLTSLQSLDLRSTQISTLPESIGNLANLKSLDLRSTQISTLPESIGNLTNLQNLDLRSAKIRTLPESIGNLTNLQSLDLNLTQIRTLPESIGRLTSLQSLDLGYTQIGALPESIGELTSLQSLDLSYTQISTLPENIWSLSSLQSLDLGYTQIGTLPESIENLSSLQSLNLGYTRISMLPKSIGNLSELQRLDLRSTKISVLPESIGDLTSLQNLYFGSTPISTLPESIGNLSRLQILTLSYTPISTLPESIWNLSSLKILDLSSTPIRVLPESMGNLFNLQSLYLRLTPISRLPESIRSLTSLQILDLSSTLISTLPESMGSLSDLQRLDLRGTQISELPENIYTLPKIKELALENLTLSELPEELLSFNLEYKNVRYDSIKETPGVYIRGLRLQKQPVSLFYQPRELIQKYYDSDKEELKESKVIFMGDGGAGKSYTIQRIKNTGLLLEKDTDVTHDITIEHWDNREHLVDYDGTIDFWDFGGQDIYLSMHRCFLTERSCYVIVLCNRQYGSHRGLMRQARYWLKNISAFAKKSPILIAVNTWSGQPRDGISLTQLRNEFPELNITDQIVYNAHDKEVEEFKRLISSICRMAKDNYSYGLQFPISWKNIRNRLLTGYRSENLLAESEYYRICQEEMTGIDGYYDKEIARWLLHWFNDLGYCFNYHDIDNDSDEEDYHVLNPRWVIRAMYKIINYKIDRNTEGNSPAAENLPGMLALSKRYSEGRIPKEDIIEILTGEQEAGDVYSEEEALYIIRVLRKFKLAYLIEDQDSEELFIPALCSDLRPDTFDDTGNLSLKTKYLVRFKYLPETVIQHLMIKCYQNDRRLRKVWKYGFHLKVKKGCLTLEMLGDTEIMIRYYEPENNNDFYGLHEMRQWLTETYNELGIEQVKDFIVKEDTRQTAYINVKALVDAYINNQEMRYYYTQDDDKYIGHSVDELLTGLYGSNYNKIIKEEAERLEIDTKNDGIAPEALSERFSYTNVANIIEARFRTQFSDPPEDEKMVQLQLQRFLDAQGYEKGMDYVRESGKISFAGREYIPDFVIGQSTVIEVKFLKDRNHKSRIVEQMNADYSAYTKEYRFLIFLVYDMGVISDAKEFKRDFEDKGNVKVIVIKH